MIMEAEYTQASVMNSGNVLAIAMMNLRMKSQEVIKAGKDITGLQCSRDKAFVVLIYLAVSSYLFLNDVYNEKYTIHTKNIITNIPKFLKRTNLSYKVKHIC